MIFIDKILNFSISIEEHNKHLKIILGTLISHNLYAKHFKCDFWIKKLIFFGHVIIEEMICVDPTKVSVVLGREAPSNASKICNFLKLASYHRRFIPYFKKISLLMTKLIQIMTLEFPITLVRLMRSKCSK